MNIGIVIMVIIILLTLDGNTRHVFQDGFNSASHFAFGLAAHRYPVIAWPFALYQAGQWCLDYSNTGVDLLEFLLGWAAGFALQAL